MTDHTMQTARVADIAERITTANAAREPLRIVGGGTWLDAGRPVLADATLSVADLHGVIEYVPSDLVITVRGGTTLASIADITAEHGQWLALDPIGDARSTVGATIATASAGPLALGSGAVRDLVLGLGAVTGSGNRIHVGGRVVKNVAGFDLVRLNTGAFGTLGVITDLSLRLHARPAADATFCITHDDPDALLRIVSGLGLDMMALQSLELMNASMAQAIGANDAPTWTLLARATGNAAAVAAQRATLARLGAVHDADPALWQGLRAADGAGSTFRVSAAPAAIASTIAQVREALALAHIADARIRATPHRGIVRVVIPSPLISGATARDTNVAAVVQSLMRSALRVIGERLPDDAWRLLPGSARDPISSRIRDAFDPHRLLNRGILGEVDA